MLIKHFALIVEEEKQRAKNSCISRGDVREGLYENGLPLQNTQAPYSLAVAPTHHQCPRNRM